MSNRKKKRDQVIVMHPPLSGEAHAVAQVIRENEITTVILPEPATVNAPRPRSPTADALAREQSRAKASRVYGLDAYRGFFLLLMTFAMTIPMREGLFPAWMYHMQYPVPGDFVGRAGLTWRDMLFPAFLFTMCTAIPITNSLRLGKGMPYPAVIWTALKRFAVLYLYALIIGHALPYWTQDYTKRGNFIAIAAFIACWPLFMRRPDAWSEEKFARVKKIGWLLGAAVLLLLPAAYGSAFSLERKDGIMHALAFVSLATTAIWLFTRTRMLARLALLGAIIAVKLASEYRLPGGDLLYRIEAPLLYQAWMIELLIVAIPATLAGDLLVAWMRTRNEDTLAWSTGRLAAIVAVCVAFIPVTLIGFYQRFPHYTAIAYAILAAIGFALSARPQGTRERILANMLRGAALLLIVGALIEPLGAGIRKDPQTLSYLVVTGAASLVLLVPAMILADTLRVGQRATRLLADVGQNPLIAYVAFTMFFNNIAWLTVFPRWQSSSASQALGYSLLFTAATAVLVVAATRKRIFWRA
ncbi:MAG: DUF5009 domain-containing protein [Gemmatimonadota bacterium]